MKTRLQELDNRIKKLEELERSIKLHLEAIKKEKIGPFKCPVCDGKGIRWG